MNTALRLYKDLARVTICVSVLVHSSQIRAGDAELAARVGQETVAAALEGDREAKALEFGAIAASGDPPSIVAAHKRLFGDDSGELVFEMAYYRALLATPDRSAPHVIDRLHARFRDDAHVLYEWGVSSARRGDLNAAIGAFQRATILDPLFTPPYYEAARHLLSDYHMPKPAIYYCTRVLMLESPNGDLAKRAGELLARAKAEAAITSGAPTSKRVETK